MYGVGASHQSAIESWRVMFLVCGGGTVLAALLFIIFMPLSPDTAWFLTPEEREIAVARMASERLSKESKSFKKSQILEFVKDHRAWLLVLGAFFNTLASPVIKVRYIAGAQSTSLNEIIFADDMGILQFATLVIKGFGWSDLNTMLVSLPAGGIQIIGIWVVVLGTKYTRLPRCAWGIISTFPALIGNIGLAVLDPSARWGTVACTWLATVLSPTMVVLLSLIASNIKGNTKKSAASNGYFIFYAAAAIAGPQLWTKPPRYTEGIITDLVSMGTVIVIFGLFYLSGKRENRRRDGLTVSDSQPGDADVTDREDLNFRYSV